MSQQQPTTPDQKRKDHVQEQFKINREESDLNELPSEENKSIATPNGAYDRSTDYKDNEPDSSPAGL